MSTVPDLKLPKKTPVNCGNAPHLKLLSLGMLQSGGAENEKQESPLNLTRWFPGSFGLYSNAFAVYFSKTIQCVIRCKDFYIDNA